MIFHIFLLSNIMLVLSILILHAELLNTVLLILIVSLSLFFKKFNFRSIRLTLGLDNFYLCLALTFISLVVLICQAVFLDEVYDGFGRGSLSWARVALVSNLVWFYWGVLLARTFYLKSSLPSILYCLVLLVSIIYNIEDVFRGVVFAAANTNGGTATFNHLFVSGNVAVLFFFCYSAVGRSLKVVFFIVFTFVLFSLQGRSALVGAILAICVGLLLTGKKRELIDIALVGVVGFACIVVVVGFENITLKLGDRFALSGGVMEDKSLQYRLQGFTDGANLLLRQFFIGNPTLLIKELGGLGGYMHNIISAWQLYGAPFFIFVLAMVLYGGVRLLRYFNKYNSFHFFVVLLFVYSLVQVLIAQSVVFKVFWLSLGMAVSLREAECKERLLRLGRLAY